MFPNEGGWALLLLLSSPCMRHPATKGCAMQVGETLTLAFLMQRALVRGGPTRLLRFQATYF